MSLESATWATQLNTSNPQSSDPRSNGDDHLRMIKSVIQTELSPANRDWIYTGNTVVRQSTTSFTTTGDQSSVYPQGRKVKIVGDSTGTAYGLVTDVTYSASTAVKVSTNPGLSNESLVVYVGAQTGERVLSVDDFGAAGDGATDDSTAIQAAIDHLESIGGGKLTFSNKDYAIATGLVIEEDNIYLEGQGSIGKYGGGKADLRARAATRLVWTGASGTGSMVKFTADSGDTGTRYAREHGGISRIFIDGVELASVGLEVQSWRNLRVDDVCVAYVQDFGYKIWTLPAGVVAGAADTQHCNFINCTYMEQNTAQTPVGMILGTGGGSGAGNASFNSFFNLQLSCSGNGSALEIENTDNNVWYGLRCGGTGGIILHADDTGQLYASGGASTARYNSFYGLECVGGVTAKATVAGSTSSFSNQIWGLSQSNGGTTLTKEFGSELWSFDSEGAATFEQLAVRTRNDTSIVTPAFFLTKDSDVGEVNDGLGKIQWRMTNDAGSRNQDAGRINANIIDPTAGSETARISFTPMYNGSETMVQFALQNGAIFGDGVTAVSFLGAGHVNVSNGYHIGNGPSWTQGAVTPEGNETASPGSLYSRTDDGTLWVKNTGSGDTGWLTVTAS